MDIQCLLKTIKRLAERYRIGCRIDAFENIVIKLILSNGEDKINNAVLFEAVACMYAARYFGGEFLVNFEDYEEDEYHELEDCEEDKDYELDEDLEDYEEDEYYELDDEESEDYNYDSSEYEEFEEDNSEKVFFIVKFKNDSDQYEFMNGVLCD